jgi:hypothetical protein
MNARLVLGYWFKLTSTEVSNNESAVINVNNYQHYVIKFVSDLRQVGGFLQVLRFPPQIKLTAMIITEIWLKVALNTIKQTNNTTGY